MDAGRRCGTPRLGSKNGLLLRAVAAARYEQTKGGTGQMAGNYPSCKQWGSLSNKRRNLQADSKPHSWGDKCPGVKQRKVGKGRNLWCSNVTFAPYALITIKQTFK